ncbi:MAG TPA: hypothetical protein VJZ26_10190 [Blastocatellia bacterium]|nr:hypothetical protein [Blastocatellia bacterium]
MQRINKQTTAPFGLAFIFLGLAIVPMSLKAVGVNISFAPRVNAVANAWNRITGGVSNPYQPLGTAELSAVNVPDCCDKSNPVEAPAQEPCQMACLEEQSAPACCEQSNKTYEWAVTTVETPQCRGEKAAPRVVAMKRNIISSFKSESRSGRKFEIPVIEVQSLAEPIVASQTELASLIEKRMARYRFQMRAFRIADSTKNVRVVFETVPAVRPERPERSGKDCDSTAKPSRFRTLLPAPVVERAETRGA